MCACIVCNHSQDEQLSQGKCLLCINAKMKNPVSFPPRKLYTHIRSCECCWRLSWLELFYVVMLPTDSYFLFVFYFLLSYFSKQGLYKVNI